MKRITNLKKRIVGTCLAGCILFSGAGLILRPAQTSAYAAGEETSWIAYPRISGWEFGGFGLENVFYALPEQYGDYILFTFHYDTDYENNKWADRDVYATADANGVLTYYQSQEALNRENGYSAEELVTEQGSFGVLFNEWGIGNYTMTVTTALGGIRATVPFTVRQAKNYWTKSPSILSWDYNKRGDYSLPAAEAKFGKAEYLVYSAKTNADGKYETDADGEYVKDALYYDSTDEKKNKLADADEGIYLLVAYVAEKAEYEGLESTAVFRVFASSATEAALEAAKEAAVEEIEALARELGVTSNASGTIHGASLKEVEAARKAARLQVYRTYAEKKIEAYAQGKVNNYETVVADQLRDIRDANTEEDILSALGENEKKGALQILEEVYAHNTLAPRKITELREYAQEMGALADGFAISTGSLETNLEDAKTEKELALAFTAAKKSVASDAYGHGSSDLNKYNELARETVMQTALYIGIEYKEESSNVILRYIERIIDSTTKEQIDAVVAEALGTEGFRALLTTMQANLRDDLERIALRYAERYSSVAVALNGIIVRAQTGMYEPETFARSEEKYNTYLKEIRGTVLDPAKTEAIKQIRDLLEETGLKSFDIDSVEAAINAARTIDEAETLLEAAINEIGSTLFETRAEKIAELEEYADQYYADYNWNGILEAVKAGKAAINDSQKYSDILDKFEDAKLRIFKAHIASELDRYAEVYGIYDVAQIIEAAKNDLRYARSEEECAGVLADASNTLCAAAKESAAEKLASLNVNYPSWNRAPWVSQINAAETVAKVDEAYKQAETELVSLVSERDNAVTTAREMLTVYAESYGVENLDAVKNALTGLNTAQTKEDVPLLFDKAKLEIDKAAEAEQQRVDSVNTALIVLVVIFGFTAIGLGVAFALVLHRYLPKKKKTRTPPQADFARQPAPQDAASQEQIGQNPFLQAELGETAPQSEPTQSREEQAYEEPPQNLPEN